VLGAGNVFLAVVKRLSNSCLPLMQQLSFSPSVLSMALESSTPFAVSSLCCAIANLTQCSWLSSDKAVKPVSQNTSIQETVQQAVVAAAHSSACIYTYIRHMLFKQGSGEDGRLLLHVKDLSGISKARSCSLCHTCLCCPSYPPPRDFLPLSHFLSSTLSVTFLCHSTADTF